MKFFKAVKMEEAAEILRDLATGISPTEKVKLMDSLNRVISEDIKSHLDLPSYDRSTVDGYAVISRECQIASETIPTLLEISGEVRMGEIYREKLQRGKAIYVPTGGMVPEGADSVVMIEYCDRLGEEVLVNRGTSQFQNMVKRGEEISAGEVVVHKGEKITPNHIGVLAAIGAGELEVYKKLSFSIISTGDEIISLDEEYSLGKIYDINSYAIEAYLREKNFDIKNSNLVKDDMEELKKTLERGISESDIILISGGSSVGTRDFTATVIEELGGEILVHGIEIKPGKPTIIAKCSGKVIIGLPGHPQSAMNVLRFAVDSIAGEGGRKIYGKALENIAGEPGKAVFINVKISEKDGEIFVEPILSRSSMIRPMLESDGYIIIPDSSEGIYRGERVEVILNG